MSCADNSGAKSLYMIEAYGIGARLNRLPVAGVASMFLCSVKKGKPELRKKSESDFISICRRRFVGVGVRKWETFWLKRSGWKLVVEGSGDRTSWPWIA